MPKVTPEAPGERTSKKNLQVVDNSSREPNSNPIESDRMSDRDKLDEILYILLKPVKYTTEYLTLIPLLKEVKAAILAWSDRRTEKAVKEADGNVSDGFHTFNELYDHRIALFIALTQSFPDISWRSHEHSDGSTFEGWFIAGMELPTGRLTYHLPIKDWQRLDGIKVLESAPEWDGSSSAEELERLNKWIEYRKPKWEGYASIEDAELKQGGKSDE